MNIKIKNKVHKFILNIFLSFIKTKFFLIYQTYFIIVINLLIYLKI